MRHLRFPIAALFLGLAGTASAQDLSQCHAQVNGSEMVVDFDRSTDIAREITRREALFRGPGRLWAWTWGDVPTCNSSVLMTALATELGAEDTDGYCLAWVDETESYVLAPGARNYRGRCVGVACQFVNAASEEVSAIGGEVLRRTGVSAAVQDPLGTGVRALSHGSGALMATGQAGTLTSFFSGTGSTLMATLSTPAVATAGTVTAVIGGGALFVCSG